MKYSLMHIWFKFKSKDIVKALDKAIQNEDIKESSLGCVTLTDTCFEYYEGNNYSERKINIDLKTYYVEGAFTVDDSGCEDIPEDKHYDCGSCTECADDYTLQDILKVFFDDKYLNDDAITTDTDFETVLVTKDGGIIFNTCKIKSNDGKTFFVKNDVDPINLSSMNIVCHENKLYHVDNVAPLNVIKYNGKYYFKDKLTPIEENSYKYIDGKKYLKSSMDNVTTFDKSEIVVENEYDTQKRHYIKKYYLKKDLVELENVFAYFWDTFYLKSNLKEIDPKNVVVIERGGEVAYYHLLDDTSAHVNIPKDVVLGKLYGKFSSSEGDYGADCFFKLSKAHLTWTDSIEFQYGYKRSKYIVEYNNDLYVVNEIFLKTASGDFVKYEYSTADGMVFDEACEDEEDGKIVVYDDEDGKYYYPVDFDNSTDIYKIYPDAILVDCNKYKDKSCCKYKCYRKGDATPIDVIEVNNKFYLKNDLKKLKKVSVIYDCITKKNYMADKTAIANFDFEVVSNNNGYYKFSDDLVPCNDFDFPYIIVDGSWLYRLEDLFPEEECKEVEYDEHIGFAKRCVWDWYMDDSPF